MTLFKQRPGADAKLGKDPNPGRDGRWGRANGRSSSRARGGWRVYAKVTPKERGQFVCRADRSEIWTWGVDFRSGG